MTTPRTRGAGRLAVAALFAAGLLLVACGDDDDGADTTTTTTGTPSTDAPTDTADDDTSGDEDVVEVELVDYAFEGLPDSVPAGTRLTITNTSENEVHELVAVRLPDDEERSLEELLALPDEEADALLGSGPPAAVLVAPPGGEQVDAVGDGTLTEPGRYLLLCAIPTGVDPDEYFAAAEEAGEGPPEIPGAGPPHFVQGMVGELIVE